MVGGEGGRGAAQAQLTEMVQRLYAEVRALLDSLEPKAVGWEAKVREPTRCGLVKAVCRTDEHAPYEWVEERWKGHYEQRGSALLEMSESVASEICIHFSTERAQRRRRK